MAISRDSVLNALRGVIDPELGDNVVDLGMVRDVQIDGSVVDVHFALTTASCPLRTQLRDDLNRHVGAVPGVSETKITVSEMNADEKKSLMQKARLKAQQDGEIAVDIPDNTRVVAVASGKGGVGKSSITANLASGIAERGFIVGVLDADIWGFSQPRMLGISGELEVEDKKMQPIVKRVGKGELRVISMGFLSNEQEAIMWRGLILNRAVQHFLEDVAWGELDYLFIDLPPGTGDIQMGLARMLPRTEMIIVTTPALAAQNVASRAADMAQRGFMRIAGVIENMSAFVANDGMEYKLFGEGGGQRLSEEVGIPLLGSIPIDGAVAQGGDAGEPAVGGSSPASIAFSNLIDTIVNEALPPIDMSNCSTRLVDAMEQAAQSAVE